MVPRDVQVVFGLFTVVNVLLGYAEDSFKRRSLLSSLQHSHSVIVFYLGRKANENEAD